MKERIKLIEKQVCDYYINNFVSCVEISKLFKINRKTVIKLLTVNSIPIRNAKELRRKYSVNHDFFETIDSEAKAYFLGIIISDGCVSNNQLIIGLQEEDKYILEKFIELIDYTGKIYTIEDNRKESYKNKCVVTITSDKIVDDLGKLGIVPAKSDKTYFPNISKEFYSHFIRGVFDGDGCITTYKPKNKVSPNLFFSITGNITLIVKIQEILMENCDINRTKLNYLNLYKESFRTLSYGGNIQAKRIFNYLYDNSTLYLTRKHNKFTKILI